MFKRDEKPSIGVAFGLERIYWLRKQLDKNIIKIKQKPLIIIKYSNGIRPSSIRSLINK